MIGKLFVISAPSGAGKTTLVDTVLKSVGNKYALKRVITYTSRVPRPGEENTKDYYFISESAFKAKIDQGFLEYSTVYGTYYGSPRSIIEDLKRGISYFLILDRRGLEQIIDIFTDLVSIWVSVDVDILKQRLMMRNSETQSQIEHRLLLAQKELELEQTYSLYNHHIFNNNLQKAAISLEALLEKYFNF